MKNGFAIRSLHSVFSEERNYKKGALNRHRSNLNLPISANL